jgi:predicted small metal-binding protein
MKTTTCRQLGAPCDFAHHGATADDVIKTQDRHLKEMATGGDADHQLT